MGYTHCFEHEEVDQNTWNKILLACRQLFGNTEPDLLAGSDGTGLPIFNKDEICFNGLDDGLYETFLLQRKGSNGFEFCKTARKPYDLMVCACLIVYQNISPQTIDLSSDGGLEDWAEALDFVHEHWNPDYTLVLG